MLWLCPSSTLQASAAILFMILCLSLVLQMGTVARPHHLVPPCYMIWPTDLLVWSHIGIEPHNASLFGTVGDMGA
jgi:hypothetical protein